MLLAKWIPLFPLLRQHTGLPQRIPFKQRIRIIHQPTLIMSTQGDTDILKLHWLWNVFRNGRPMELSETALLEGEPDHRDLGRPPSGELLVPTQAKGDILKRIPRILFQHPPVRREWSPSCLLQQHCRVMVRLCFGNPAHLFSRLAAGKDEH